MQYKPPYHESTSQNIMAVILHSLPSESYITKIEYEGPRIALYSKNPSYLIQNTQILSNMVNTIKKRIIVRTDESIRKPEEERPRNQCLPLDILTKFYTIKQTREFSFTKKLARKFLDQSLMI